MAIACLDHGHKLSYLTSFHLTGAQISVYYFIMSTSALTSTVGATAVRAFVLVASVKVRDRKNSR